MSTPLLTVCLPVYQGEEFVAQTIESILSQSFSDFLLHISVDQSNDNSLAICQHFATEPRVRVVQQHKRLGWRDNCNFLMDRVATPYFKIAPHDDIVSENTLADLLGLMESCPEVVCAVPDIRGFGDTNPQDLCQLDTRGPLLRRLIDIIMNQRCVAAFHGVVRNISTPPIPRLPEGFRDDFEGDAQWLLQLAIHGEIRRVDNAVIKKRFSEKMTSQNWGPANAQAARQLIVDHAVMMTHSACYVLNDDQDKLDIILAAISRVCGLGLNYGVSESNSHVPLSQPILTQKYLSLLKPEIAQIIESTDPLELLKRIESDRGMLMGSMLSKIGQQAFEHGQYNKAKELVERVLVLDPLSSWAESTRAKLKGIENK